MRNNLLSPKAPDFLAPLRRRLLDRIAEWGRELRAAPVQTLFLLAFHAMLVCLIDASISISL